MYPTKEDIQFFYDLGVYTQADVMSYVAQGSITEEEAKMINPINIIVNGKKIARRLRLAY